MKISQVEFVKIWQRADSLAEVCAKTGQVPNSVQVRAMRYRRAGIPLKKFFRRNSEFSVETVLELRTVAMRELQAYIERQAALLAAAQKGEGR